MSIKEDIAKITESIPTLLLADRIDSEFTKLRAEIADLPAGRKSLEVTAPKEICPDCGTSHHLMAVCPNYPSYTKYVRSIDIVSAIDRIEQRFALANNEFVDYLSYEAAADAILLTTNNCLRIVKEEFGRLGGSHAQRNLSK